MARRGRPLKPLDPDATMASWLGAELRARRVARDLTQQALGDLIGYSPQHVSEVERARTAPAQPFIVACDDALDAGEGSCSCCPRRCRSASWRAGSAPPPVAPPVAGPARRYAVLQRTARWQETTTWNP